MRPRRTPAGRLAAGIPPVLAAAVAVAVTAGVAAGPPRAAAGPPRSGVECGTYCLHVAQKGLGGDASLATVRRATGEPTAAGYSIGQLRDAAVRLGLHARPVRTSLSRLRRRRDRGERFACIAHTDATGGEHGDRGGHFLLVTGRDADGLVRVIDPPRSLSVEPAVLNARWEGFALLVSARPLVAEAQLRGGGGDRLPVASAVALAGLAVILGACVMRFRGRRREGGSATAGAAALLCAVSVGCDLRGADGPAVAPIPRADFGVQERDLGSIPATNARREVRFRIANRGAGTLHLSRPTVNCTCVGARLSDRMVRPGEAADLVLTIVPDRTGRESATAVVRTDDPRRPAGRVRVIWEAVAAVRYNPPAVSFGTVPRGSERERTVVMRGLPDSGTDGGEDPKIVPDDAPLHLTLGPPEADGRRSMTVRLRDDAPVGRGRAELVRGVGVDGEALAVLPVRWEVRERRTLRPANLLIAADRPGAHVRGAVAAYGEATDSAPTATVQGWPGARVSVGPRIGDRWTITVSGPATAAGKDSPPTLGVDFGGADGGRLEAAVIIDVRAPAPAAADRL